MGEGDETLPADREGARGSLLAAEAATFAARRYEARDELARGGAGRIVRAWDLALDREVALKEPLDPQTGRRLRAEAHVLAKLQHPSIVPVYDAGTRVDGTPFFAMKLVNGQSLRDAIRARQTLELRLALVPVVVAIAEAVAYAHANGVLHRDLKPANVLLGEFGETVVIDWGLAKSAPNDDLARGTGAMLASDIATATGAVMGTPAYMAPEQARGEAVDARADVYALGAILYEVLAGASPYADSGGLPVIQLVAEDAPTKLSSLQPRTPRDLVAIVDKAMARDPSHRYPTAKELADDLVRFQTGRLVAARRYSPIVRARRWLSRHRLRAIAAAGVVAAAAMAIAVVARSDAGDAQITCERTADRARATWNLASRAQLVGAFVRSGASYGPSTANAVADQLDAYADRLAAARVEACAATHVRGEQSEALLDTRMRCLDERLIELDTAASALVRADRRGVENASNLVGALDSVDDCARVKQLAMIPPEPVDVAKRVRIDALNARLSILRTAVLLHTQRDVLPEADAVVAEARAVGYCGVTMGALGVAGVARGQRAANKEQLAAAATTLREAVRTADACGDDHQRAMVLVKLYELGAVLQPPPDLDAILDEAQAAAQRSGDPESRAATLAKRADRAGARGDLDRAIALWTEAVGVADTLTSADPSYRMNLAHAYVAKGVPDRGIEPARASLEAMRRFYGDDHPRMAEGYLGVAMVENARGHAEDALALARKGLAIEERAYGPEHRKVVIARNMVASIILSLDRYDEARKMIEAALPTARKVFGPEHELVTTMLFNLASADYELGQLAHAETTIREVIAIRTHTVGASHIKTAGARQMLGKILLAAHRDAEAAVELRAALAVQERVLDPASEDVTATRGLLARARK